MSPVKEVSGTNFANSTNITLHVQRMHADRISVNLSAAALVDDLREIIRTTTDIPTDRQRIIFRGRVLKTGDRLSVYGLEEGSVLHLVERAEGSSERLPTNNTTHGEPQMPRAGGVMFHSMELDPSMGPISIASQITHSLMGALSNVLGVPPTPNNNSSVNVTSAAESTSPSPPQGMARVVSRPTPRMTDAGSGTHNLIRMDLNRALNNINADLLRLTTFSDGADIFPPITTTSSSTIPPPPQLSVEQQQLFDTMASFERTYGMLATACHEVCEGVRNGQLPWDRLHNLVGMLQEIPLLVVVQRRLLSTLRARPSPSNPQQILLEMPSSLDVPSFLDRPNEPSSSPPSSSTTPLEDIMDSIEPPE